VPKRWGNFGQGYEDEIALQHARMRDLQFGRVDGRLVVKKNVEVDQARAFREGFLATHTGFDLTQCPQERRGCQVGLRRQHRIEEPGLVEIIDGLRFVQAGSLKHPDRGTVQAADGFAEIFLAFAPSAR